MLDDSLPTERLQRAEGRAEVAFDAGGLRHLYQSGCAKVLLPRSFQPVPEAVFINTSGGITGGDRLDYVGEVAKGAELCLTTQAAERIYKSISGTARVCNTLRLGESSLLEWLPQETILFEGSALSRRLDVEMPETARLMAVETLVLGRRAMGETLQHARLSDQWRIRRGGGLVYADALRFSAPAFETQTIATLNGNRALATVLYVAPDAEPRLRQARELLSCCGGEVEAAASAWNGIISLRFLAADIYPLRKALVFFLTRFRGRDLPRGWHM